MEPEASGTASSCPAPRDEPWRAPPPSVGAQLRKTACISGRSRGQSPNIRSISIVRAISSPRLAVPRSKAKVDIAVRQPLFSPPTTFDSGMRTAS